jgi:hypothetical protein
MPVENSSMIGTTALIYSITEKHGAVNAGPICLAEDTHIHRQIAAGVMSAWFRVAGLKRDPIGGSIK